MNCFTIVSSGKALPARAVPAASLDERLQLPRGTTLKRSGISQRYFADQELRQSELAAQALQDALKRGGVAADSIDLLISACAIAEQALPNTASAISAHAGLVPGTPAMDINVSCLSFMAALNVAAALCQTQYKRIAIVSADLPSRGLDWSNPEASYIFGDGAAALIIERPQLGSEPSTLKSFQLGTFPSGREFCEVRAGGTRCNPRTAIAPSDYLFKMDGKAVFKAASKHLGSFLSNVLAESGLTIEEIDWVVPHQASHLGMAHARERLGIPRERIIDIYEHHGNQVAASMPTALHELLTTRPNKPGDNVLLLGTAAGLTLGAGVITL